MLTTTFTEARERAGAFAVFGAIAGSGIALGLLLRAGKPGPVGPDAAPVVPG